MCVSVQLNALWCSMLRKIIHQSRDHKTYGTEHGTEETVTRKLTFENVWGAPSRSFCLLPSLPLRFPFFGLVKHCFAFGTSIFAAFSFSKSMWLFVSSLIHSAFCLLAWICFFSHTGSRVRLLLGAPLKWFFDMLDNEHLIMLTCVYY